MFHTNFSNFVLFCAIFLSGLDWFLHVEQVQCVAFIYDNLEALKNIMILFLKALQFNLAFLLFEDNLYAFFNDKLLFIHEGYVVLVVL